MTKPDADHAFMGLAIRAARKGTPSPNPHVGAVIVKRGEVIATGHHERAGTAHAEVNAIDNAARSVRGATMYVTLMPCDHHGRTGPCTQAVIDAGIKRIVVGSSDPTPHTTSSQEVLERAGVRVTTGVREDECDELIEDFTKHFRTGRPLVVLKGATTLDGRIATKSGDSKWITGLPARKQVHRLRARADAVLVGIETVLLDDPQLNVRMVRGQSPIPVVLDSKLRTPVDSNVVKRGALIFHGPRASARRKRALTDAGAVLHEVGRSASGLDLEAVLDVLGERDVVRLLVEGGGRVLGSFLSQGLADRASIFVAPLLLGDASGRPLMSGGSATRMSEAWALTEPQLRRRGNDMWFEGKLERRRDCSQDS